MYFGEMALADLDGVDLIVLVETVAPVAFFAYPDRPSVLVPPGCEVATLATRQESGVDALAALADRLGAPATPVVQPRRDPDPANGKLTPAAAGRQLHRPAALPEGRHRQRRLGDLGPADPQPHPVGELRRTIGWVWTGGAIGQGDLRRRSARRSPHPAARCSPRSNGDGAAAMDFAVACGRWRARRRDVDGDLFFANHTYRILGASSLAAPAPAILLRRPRACSSLGMSRRWRWNWIAWRGFGLPAHRCETAEAFDEALALAMREPGPRLIEAVID